MIRLARTLLVSCLLVSTAIGQTDLASRFQSDFLQGKLAWESVLEAARVEGEVQFFYWGGDDNLNIWMDTVVVPAMAELGVTLRTNRITGTKDAVDLVLAEAAAGKGIGDGSVDAIWLNGENFFTLKQQGQLFGSFAQALPNSVHFEWDERDPRSTLNLRDFGTPTEGMEVPWSGEQYVCVANRRLMSVDQTPSDFAGLRAYLEARPGKFAYVKPPHYLGNTFVQQVLYAFNPDGTGALPFQASISELGTEELARLIEPGFVYLRELEPLLVGGPQGAARYPEDGAAADGLFRNSEIHLTCGFGLYAVATKRANGSYPATAEEIIFPAGNMIKNKNYLAIPANAPNPAAALVLANYMASVDAQVTRLELVGYPAGIDPWRLSAEDAAKLEAAAPPHFGVTAAELDANIAPDTNASLVDVIEAVWLDYIERRSDEPFAAIVARATAPALATQ
ncbi:ABC transporter substrate-binding protein [Devosia sp.]|jgi:putative spermidine/putrescine transport system substrate-binding protein|uniref:ABC transporter substrate-binding protein n=1 Tax=Devosia sp. TaxID=1871048 RepID=UPI0037C14B0D